RGVVIAAADRPFDLLLAVRVVDERLVLVGGERHVPGGPDRGAVAGRHVRRVVPPADALLDPDVPHERAGLRVHVNAVTLAIVHVHKPVRADVHRVDDLQEPERSASLRVGDRALFTPHPSCNVVVLPGTENDYAPVPVSVGDVHLSVSRIYENVRRSVEKRRAVVRKVWTVLHTDLALERAPPIVFLHDRVGRSTRDLAVSGDPDVTL